MATTEPSRLTLVRHGSPESGAVDPPLSARGRAEAERAADVLATAPVDAVLTSPLRRAIETARPIAARHGLCPEVHDVLQEWSDPAINAEPYTTLEDLVDIREAMARGDYGEIAPPGVDLARLRETLLAVADEVATRFDGGHVVVSFHGGNINVLVGALIGVDDPVWFNPAYTGITRIARLQSGRWVVESVNETGHLRADGLR